MEMNEAKQPLLGSRQHKRCRNHTNEAPSRHHHPLSEKEREPIGSNSIGAPHLFWRSGQEVVAFARTICSLLHDYLFGAHRNFNAAVFLAPGGRGICGYRSSFTHGFNAEASSVDFAIGY